MSIFHKAKNTDVASEFTADLYDAAHWQTMTVSEQDAAVTDIKTFLGLSYKHLYTRSYEKFADNRSLRIPTFKHRLTGVEFNLVLGGIYKMGFSSHEEAAMLALDHDALFSREVLPSATSVRVEPFLMSRLPVLDSFARKYMDIDPSLFRPEFSQKPKDKVPIYLTRDEINILLEKTGFDMPSECQWEYAFRGLTSTLFPFGDILLSQGEMTKIFLDIYNNQDKCFEAANPFGLLGMFIGEWCQDPFFKDRSHINANGQPVCISQPYAIRGGGSSVWPWQGEHEWTLCMSAARWNSGTLEDGTCGVRLVKNLVLPKT